MRTLLLLRGAPGSGKSTFIKKNGIIDLSPWTLSPDTFRLMLGGPVLNEDSWHIPQNQNKQAFELMMRILEERMGTGEFTVIDATHSSKESMMAYKDLADLYKYSVFCMEFDNTHAKEQNKSRIFDNDGNVFPSSWKKVSDEVIERMTNKINRVQIPSYIKKIEKLEDILNFYTMNFDKYDEVRLVGDLQGCATVLNDFIQDEDGLKDNVAYVFLGDYFDRGIENYKTLKTLQAIMDKPNVFLVEGNHDLHVRNWANDLKRFRIPQTFYEKTRPELINGYMQDHPELSEETAVANLKKELRVFYKRLRQALVFTFHGQKYLCNHAGVPHVNVPLSLISANDFIKGQFSYNADIAPMFARNKENYANTTGICDNSNIIQFHGHRFTSEENSISPYASYCIESKVEFGKDLVTARIDKNNVISFKRYENLVFNYDMGESDEDYTPSQNGNENLIKNAKTHPKIVELAKSGMINVKECDNNLVSANFKKGVFYKKQWNDLTIKTRGLFLDKDTGDIKVRAYEKFFNIHELQGVTDEKSLEKNLKFPVKAWKKENGFLGMYASVNGEPVLASKTTTDGDYAKLFKDCWSFVDEATKKAIDDYAKQHNCTFVFEVIHPEDNGHPIKYDGQRHLFLLDVVKNQEDYQNITQQAFDDLKDVLQKDGIIQTKELVTTCHSWGEVKEAMEKVKNTPIEGFVFEDASGFHFKYKTDYYLRQKRMRNTLERRANNENSKKISIL